MIGNGNNDDDSGGGGGDLYSIVYRGHPVLLYKQDDGCDLQSYNSAVSPCYCISMLGALGRVVVSFEVCC